LNPSLSSDGVSGIRSESLLSSDGVSGIRGESLSLGEGEGRVRVALLRE